MPQATVEHAASKLESIAHEYPNSKTGKAYSTRQIRNWLKDLGLPFAGNAISQPVKSALDLYFQEVIRGNATAEGFKVTHAKELAIAAQTEASAKRIDFEMTEGSDEEAMDQSYALMAGQNDDLLNEVGGVLEGAMLQEQAIAHQLAAALHPGARRARILAMAGKKLALSGAAPLDQGLAILFNPELLPQHLQEGRSRIMAALPQAPASKATAARYADNLG